MTDLINFKDGWQLSQLTKTPKGYYVVIEKNMPISIYPHYETKYKAGHGVTQREACENAVKMKGFAWTDVIEGTRENLKQGA